MRLPLLSLLLLCFLVGMASAQEERDPDHVEPAGEEEIQQWLRSLTYFRLWMALDDDLRPYTVRAVQAAGVPRLLFGRMPGTHHLGGYQRFGQGSWSIQLFKGDFEPDDPPEQEWQMEFEKGKFSTLILTKSGDNYSLLRYSDTLPDEAMPAVKLFNFLDGNDFRVAITEGEIHHLESFAPPEAMTGLAENTGEIFVEITNSNGDGDENDRLHLELPIDLRISPHVSLVLIRDNYGFASPRILYDGILMD